MDFSSSRVLWISTARLILQVLLLTIFLCFFGLPAIEKYEKKGCYGGWDKQRNTRNFVSSNNNFSQEPETTRLPCPQFFIWKMHRFSKPTYNSSELLDSVVLGFTRREILNLVEASLREDFTVLFTGIYFTLNLSLIATPNFLEDQIILQLHQGHFISVFKHDPHFFLRLNPPISDKRIKQMC